ncbi:MAG: PspA/IM30 family protein [Deltaproteobacteria bacterium]|jgi:phage shock protein A|nr:PspA/IM30 family protein [Deltaproteobacteria bacterium]
MGLLQRIGDLLRSNINDLITKAEDPERMLNSAIEEMQRQIIEAKGRVAGSIADEKRLAKTHEVEAAKAEDWEKKAMLAIKAGRDDLAVEALAKKKEHQAGAALFAEQLASQKAAVEELKRALALLTTKLEDTRRKRNLLVARAKRAEAQRQIADTLTAANEVGAGDRLERFEARVEQQEAQAEATWEMAALGGGSGDRDLARQIDALGEGELNDDLLALKGKMASLGMLEAGAARPALPAGAADEPSGSPASDSDPSAEVREES